MLRMMGYPCMQGIWISDGAQAVWQESFGGKREARVRGKLQENVTLVKGSWRICTRRRHGSDISKIMRGIYVQKD